MLKAKAVTIATIVIIPNNATSNRESNNKHAKSQDRAPATHIVDLVTGKLKIKVASYSTYEFDKTNLSRPYKLVTKNAILAHIKKVVNLVNDYLNGLGKP